jgi:hypothetical protein
LNYARQRIIQRYEDRNDIFASIGQKLEGGNAIFAKAGIDPHCKVIVFPDLTPNGGLYFINRSGWNVRDTSATSMDYIRKYIHEGADYILCTDKQVLKNPVISEFLGKQIIETGNFVLFKTISPEKFNSTGN